MPNKLTLSNRLKQGWNAFKNKDPAETFSDQLVSTYPYPGNSYYRPDRRNVSYSAVDTTILNSIMTRFAVDAAASSFEHIITDENGGFLETVDSGLNYILTVEANIDQTAKEFLYDLIISMLDEGCVACVPVDTRNNPVDGLSAFDIYTMRVGKITNWWSDRVAVEIYNEFTGAKEVITVLKKSTAIVTNPFYSVMNEPNSTMKRLSKRLALLDIADERVSANKLDMIIQVPYKLGSDLKRQQADIRRDEIVDQLMNSEYGIAYADSTEKIVQLNRPLENNLKTNAEYLTKLLYEQLGLSQDILDMTASEQTMVTYYRRVIDTINQAIISEFDRKFITRTARAQNHALWYHTEPFQFTPTSMIAELADKLIRNEVVTKNEMRGIIGYKPIDDPNADVLSNPNMPHANNTYIEEDVLYEEPEDDYGVEQYE